jgi:Ni/Co efflux regulator RcnB
MAALLAATAMVAGATPAAARAQDLRMDEGPRARAEGGPAGRLERSEGRPLFNNRESFPENRPAYRPDHAEAPRQAPPVARPAPGDGGGRGDRWRDRPEPSPAPLPGAERAWGNRRGGWRGQPEPMPRPDPGPSDVRVERQDRGPGAWRGDRNPQWQNQRQDQRWRDDERRQREERDRFRRNNGDWRDHGDQAYGFAERRGWADQWNRSWRRDQRYDWMGWRSLNRGAYHLPRYYGPGGGYGYQRFSSGVILEPMFFGQNYWLDDPFAYRLPPAYGAYRWVRYYNDAILVDLRSGLVVDVVYDIFW